MDDEIWNTISHDAKDLIRKLLTKSQKRLSAAEALNHIWFKKFCDSSPVDPECAKNCLQELKGFAKVDKFKQAVMRSVALQTTAKETKDLRHLFKLLDSKGEGTLM